MGTYLFGLKRKDGIMEILKVENLTKIYGKDESKVVALYLA